MGGVTGAKLKLYNTLWFVLYFFVYISLRKIYKANIKM